MGAPAADQESSPAPPCPLPAGVLDAESPLWLPSFLKHRELESCLGCDFLELGPTTEA